MGDDHQLDGIEDILPDDIRRSSERRHGVEVGVRHPYTEGGVLLSESLPGSDRRDACHRRRCRGCLLYTSPSPRDRG